MENILFEKHGHIGIITISRPKSLNALNIQTLIELDGIVDQAAEDRDIFCVIITGAGDKAFVAGADIAEMKDMDDFGGRSFGILGNKVFRKLELMEKPVIAAVNGYALGGGCELSLSCDIRIAAETAMFGQPETTLGIIPGFGGTQRLARIVGVGKAKELLYTGRTIDAAEAFRIGLVNKVVPKERVMEEAMDMASKIAGNAPIALMLCKAAINRGLQCDLDTALSMESELFAQCFTTQDQKDGMNAFVNKTKIQQYNNR